MSIGDTLGLIFVIVIMSVIVGFGIFMLGITIQDWWLGSDVRGRRLDRESKATCPGCQRGSVLLIWPEEREPAVEKTYGLRMGYDWAVRPAGVCRSCLARLKKIETMERDAGV